MKELSECSRNPRSMNQAELEAQYITSEMDLPCSRSQPTPRFLPKERFIEKQMRLLG